MRALAPRFGGRGVTTGVIGVLLGVTFLAATARGDEYAGCEYLRGQPGFPKRMKGALLIGEKGVQFKDKNGRIAFSIPVEAIEDARRSTQDGLEWVQTGPSGFVALNTEEFVGIDIRTAEGARTTIFKVRRRQGPGMAAKIRFWVDKVKASANSA